MAKVPTDFYLVPSSVFYENPKLDPSIAMELHLEAGSHGTREEGLCAMEVVAWLAGEPHSDAPNCVSKVLIYYVQRINDQSLDGERQELKPYLTRLLDTADVMSIEKARFFAGLNCLLKAYIPEIPEIATHLPITQIDQLIYLLPFCVEDGGEQDRLRELLKNIVINTHLPSSKLFPFAKFVSARMNESDRMNERAWAH